MIEKQAIVRKLTFLEKMVSYIDSWVELPFLALDGIINSWQLGSKFDALHNDNAFHDLLQQVYDNHPADQHKVITLSVAAPSLAEKRVFQRIVVIANPVILKALHKIPRSESNQRFYQLHPDSPKISGGRAFSSVLAAIGMGILSVDEELHKEFLGQMGPGLSIVHGRDYSGNSFKSDFNKIIEQETQDILNQIQADIHLQKESEIDFRFHALKIMLQGFYPTGHWDDQWIKELSTIIEDVSAEAFKYVMNPYIDTEKLKGYADQKLRPLIDKILQEKPTYLSSAYYEKYKDSDILRQIIISLLFAGGDNIQKYLDHTFVMFGQKEIREKYLTGQVSRENIEIYTQEVARLKPIIYAQPGDALEDFVIEYEGKTYLIKAGDKLHYTTWEALVDEQEWGEDAKKFLPEKHKEKYKELKANLTFGSDEGLRHCYGETITRNIVNYIVEQVVNRFSWESKIEGDANHNHPTVFSFNNGVKGKISYSFTEKAVDLTKDLPQTNVSRVKEPPAGILRKVGSFAVKQTSQPVDYGSTSDLETYSSKNV